MRPVYLYDLDAVVRAALALPLAERAGFINLMIWRTRAADKYRKRIDRAHPRYGDGTLATAVAFRPKGGGAAIDRSYRHCLAHLLAGLGA